ncbi:MAG: hypothetical protein IPP15_13015 [Saprospiraceae bacterium]|uniref:Uncharacterized protein n=1 Tax=Candidatus Opimibacter skivensis TaxID=2982028 RepID=A0A9D7SUB2_9BACT|nr:hypothetical protein [Candidatus Opimibacter skivensis]
MVSLVFWSGIFRRNIKSIVLALIILVLYAGYFGGIVTGKEGISWESQFIKGAIPRNYTGLGLQVRYRTG